MAICVYALLERAHRQDWVVQQGLIFSSQGRRLRKPSFPIRGRLLSPSSISFSYTAQDYTTQTNCVPTYSYIYICMCVLFILFINRLESYIIGSRVLSDSIWRNRDSVCVSDDFHSLCQHQLRYESL